MLLRHFVRVWLVVLAAKVVPDMHSALLCFDVLLMEVPDERFAETVKTELASLGFGQDGREVPAEGIGQPVALPVECDTGFDCTPT